MPIVKFKVDSLLASNRFDIVCVDNSSLSRRKVRSIIDVGGAYLNGKRVRIASRQVNRGDTITLIYNDQELASLKNITYQIKDSDILYNDQDLIIVNKPAGISCQATHTQSKNHLQAMVEKYLGSGGKGVRLAHRLDKDTSGVIVLAKNDKACSVVEEQFKTHLVKKVYHAICFGKLRSSLTDNSSLSPIGKDGLVKIVKTGGRESSTLFIPKTYNSAYNVSLIECHPLTGRSHQIRVHLEHQGLVLVGEKKYGGTLFLKDKEHLLNLISNITRGMLHAACIEFSFLGKKIQVSAPYHQDFLDLKNNLKL